jgi:hypothetical protein
MACAADDSLIDRVRNIFQREYVRHHQDSHVLHFGAYPERNCPDYKSTIFFQSTYPISVNVLAVTTQSYKFSDVWVQSAVQ